MYPTNVFKPQFKQVQLRGGTALEVGVDQMVAL